MRTTLKYNLLVLLLLAFVPVVAQAVVQPPKPDKNTQVVISYEVHKIHGINTVAAEFSPYIKSNRLYFTSDRESNLITWGESNWSKTSFLNVFEATVTKLQDSVTVDKIAPLNRVINAGNHAGPLAFTSDGNQVYFTRVEVLKKRGRVARPQLYRADVDGESWSNVVKLPFCNSDFSYGHPALSRDGKQLYFASNMEGGFGGKDLYRVVLKDSVWGTPENLGDSINSNGDEVFPAFRDSTLYFSSTGWSGLGGLDVFKSMQRAKGWTTAKNLEAPMNSDADDFGLTFSPKGNYGYLSSNRADGVGKDDIYLFDVVETIIVRTRDLVGQFKYRTLKGDFAEGLEVLLVDDDGTIVATTKTGVDGKFVFKEIPLDANYSIKKMGADDVELTIFDKDGKSEGTLLANSKGEFLYRKLGADNVGTLALIDETDIDLSANTGTLSGQFLYETLSQDYPEGLDVFLIDDDGVVVFKTKTDANGNFIFNEIPLDKNLSIKSDQEMKDYSMLIFNRKGDVMAELKGNAQGEFVYRKLSKDNVAPINLFETEDPTFEFVPSSTVVYGQFKYKSLNGEIPEGLKVRVLDDNGVVISEATADSQGKFRFSDLPLDGNFTFELLGVEDADETFILAINDRYGDVVGVIDGKGNSFDYRMLNTDATNDALTQIEEVDVLLEIKNKELPRIYYELNSSYLDEISAEKLRQIADILLANESLTLNIVSHTDSYGTNDYNMNLSNQRTNGVISYLVRKGIKRSRLSGTGRGESELVNECDDAHECPDEMHRLNRRSEFQFN